MGQYVNSKKLINQIKKYDTVSFDVFDTLIKRQCIDEYNVFYIAARNLIKKYALSNSEEEIVGARIIAEKKARKKNTENEVTLDDIYDSFTIKNFKYLKELKEEEVETEYKVCVPKYELKDIYDWCKKNGKNILIVSDMYLSQREIAYILDLNGYTEYDGIYVSSALRLTKRQGDIYKRVELENKGKRIVHIGDAIKSDYVQSRFNGFGSYLVKKSAKNSSFIYPNKLYFTSKKFWKKNVNIFGNYSKNKSEYYKFGYEIFGPVLYGFCSWLKIEIEKSGVDKVFFLSRDGFLIKKIFDSLYPDYRKPLSYLYISRKAVRLPSLYVDESVDSLVKLFPQNTILTLDAFLYKIGVDYSIGSKIWEENGLAVNSCFFPSDLKKNKAMNEFCSELLKRIRNDCKKEYDIFRKFLEQNGFIGNVGIVDVGWAGTIQDMLEKIQNRKIIGFYLGKDFKTSSDRKKSYIGPSIRIQDFVAALVEYPFLAVEGSVEKYVEGVDGIVKALLSEFEYSENEKIIIEEIQQGANDAAILLKSIAFPTEDSKIIAANLIRVCRYPNKKEIQMLGELTYYEGSLNYLAKPKKIISYIFTPSLFKKDLSAAGWKIGFLTRLIKCNLNYYKVLRVIKGKR